MPLSLPSLFLRPACSAFGFRRFVRPLRRGLGTRELALPAFALTLLLAVGACRSASPASPEDPAEAALTPAAGPVGTVGAEDGAAQDPAGAKQAGSPADGAAAQAAIESAMAKLQAKGSYQVTMAAGDIRTRAWVQLPDRLRIEAEGLGQVLVIGRDTYSESQGQWSRISTSASLGEGLRQFIPDLEALVSEARSQGQETLDGQPCAVYAFDSEQDLGEGKVKATVTLWIDKASGLPRRQKVTSQDPNLSGTLTSDFSYPSDIRIEAPAVYTDLGAGAAGAGDAAAAGGAGEGTPTMP